MRTGGIALAPACFDLWLVGQDDGHHGDGLATNSPQASEQYILLGVVIVDVGVIEIPKILTC